MTLAEKKEPHHHPPLELIATNKWQAARHGLDGKFVDLESTAAPLSIREAIERLLSRVTEAAERLDCQKVYPVIRRIIKEGSGAQRQRNIYSETGSFREVISRLQEKFWQ